MKTFRKGGAVLLTLCMLLCCMIPAFAEEPKPIDLPGSNVGYLFDAETGTMTIVLTHGGKSGSIGDNPNSDAMIPDADKVKHIEIAPWVTGIGERAFAGFTGLETIRIPFTVREIGDKVFDGSGPLTIYYDGKPEEWTEIELGAGNERIKDAIVIYGSFEDDPGEPDIEPTVEPKPENLCRWCNTVHGDSFFEKVVAWVHGVLATLFRR